MVTFDICKGNPGALSFLADAYHRHLGKAEKAVNIMLTHSIEDIIEHINYEHGRGIPYQDE